jgi:hypothetical protein
MQYQQEQTASMLEGPCSPQNGNRLSVSSVVSCSQIYVRSLALLPFPPQKNDAAGRSHNREAPCDLERLTPHGSVEARGAALEVRVGHDTGSGLFSCATAGRQEEGVAAGSGTRNRAGWSGDGAPSGRPAALPFSRRGRAQPGSHGWRMAWIREVKIPLNHPPIPLASAPVEQAGLIDTNT